MTNETRVHLLIRGHVQGVWFRQSTERQARTLGLVGWVRNLPDGRVEIVAEGGDAAVDQLVAYCHAGPPAARVDHVTIDWQAPEGGFTSFEILR